MADNPTLLACPFCGHVPQDWLDFLHPTGGGWRDDELGNRVMRHYMRHNDPRGVHGQCWELGCLTHEGGCGATVHGDSREEAIAAWNRRPPVAKTESNDSPTSSEDLESSRRATTNPSAANPTPERSATLELQRLRYQADRLQEMGMLGGAENIREAVDKLEPIVQNFEEGRDAAPNATPAKEELTSWVINNLLTDSQLDVVPPGYDKALRYLG